MTNISGLYVLYEVMDGMLDGAAILVANTSSVVVVDSEPRLNRVISGIPQYMRGMHDGGSVPDEF